MIELRQAANEFRYFVGLKGQECNTLDLKLRPQSSEDCGLAHGRRAEQYRKACRLVPYDRLKGIKLWALDPTPGCFLRPSQQRLRCCAEYAQELVFVESRRLSLLKLCSDLRNGGP